MKRSLLCLFVVAPALLLAQFNPQSAKVTEAFFSDFDIDIPTPAFQKHRGFTDYDDLMDFIVKKLASHPEYVSYEYIGESQKGKKVPMITLTNNAIQGDKIRVWMQGGLHGDEPGSTEALLYLTHQLLEDDDLRPLLDHVLIRIVPMANVDGCEKLHRHAANGLDLNRDQTKFHAPESIFLKRAFIDFNPEVALDFHEFRPYRRDFAKLSDWGVTTLYDVMFLYSGNLNVPSELRLFTEDRFVMPAKRELDKHELRHSDYFTSTEVHGEIQFNRGATNPRSSATSYALSNCVSTLVEVRGVALGRTSYKRRVFTAYSVALSYLHSAVEHQDALRSVIARSNAHQPEVVVKARRMRLGEEIPFIDLASNTTIALPAIVRDAWRPTPSLVRPRPDAYLILPGNDKAIENLKILGFKLIPVMASTEREVEAYEVVQYRRDPFKYEGVHLQTVETRLQRKMVTFPEGSHMVLTDQPRSNMLTELLEPEASSSFVHFEVIKTSLGSELPVYRLISTKNP